MATMAELRQHLFFTEPVRMQVMHPEYGALTVEAFCELDAQLQAAERWDVPWADSKGDMRIAVETDALRALAERLGLVS